MLLRVLNDREGGGADVDLVVKVFYSVVPGFQQAVAERSVESARPVRCFSWNV